MTIRPVDLNGMIQRTQDVGQIKQQEDMKPVVDQQNIQIQSEKENELNKNQVLKAEKSDEEFDYDAKEGGGSQYQKNGKKRQKKEESKDRVIVKGMSGGFDIKI